MMELMYASLLLHSAKQPINEENMKKVFSSIGMTVDETKIKAAVAALEGVNIEEAISKAAVAAAPAAAPAAEKKEEKKEEDTEKKAEEAAAGLSALFG